MAKRMNLTTFYRRRTVKSAVFLSRPVTMRAAPAYPSARFWIAVLAVSLVGFLTVYGVGVLA
jgi:hypothetical protein